MNEINIEDQKGKPGIVTKDSEISFLDRSFDKIELFYESKGKKGIPIVEEGGKFRFKLIFAFPFSIVISLVAIIIFALLGAEFNPLLAQSEMIVLFFTLTSTGWLTRSKLKALLIGVTWPVVYLISWVLNIYNPFGLLPRILDNAWKIVGGLPEYLGAFFTQVPILISPSATGMIIDIVLLFVLLFFGGAILIAIISTGFWNEFGDLSKLSLIAKPICAILLIILLLVVPLGYHASTTIANGGVEFGRGVVELVSTIDLQNPYKLLNVTDSTERMEIQENFTRASDHFWNSRTYFYQFKGNILVTLVIGYLPISQSIEGFGTIDNAKINDLTNIMVNVAGGARYFTRAAPKVIFGLTDVYRGFSEVIGLDFGLPISKQIDIGSITDNETMLEEGILKIQDGISYFQDAKDDLALGLEEIFSIITTGAFNDTIQNIESGEQISNMIVGYGAGIPALIDAANATVPLVRALWNVFTAATKIAESDFENASQKLDVAEEAFYNASEIFNRVTPDPRSHVDVVGIINILKDIVALVLPFTGAGKSAINALGTIQDVVTNFQEFSNTTLENPTDPWWEGSDLLISYAADNISDAVTHINNGSDMTELILERVNNSYYGQLSPQMGNLVGQINQIMGTGGVLGNITGLNHLVECFRYTFKALWSAGYGLEAVNSAAEDPTNTTHVALYLPEPSQTFFSSVVDNCTLAQAELDQASGIDAETLTTLGDVLGLLQSSAALARDACATGNATSPEFQFLLDSLNNIQDILDGIFGGLGGGKREIQNSNSKNDDNLSTKISPERKIRIIPNNTNDIYNIHLSGIVFPLVLSIIVLSFMRKRFFVIKRLVQIGCRKDLI